MRQQGISQSMTLVAWIGVLLILPVQTIYVGVSAPRVIAQQPTLQLPQTQLKQLAQSITVKILSGDSEGSGVLIKKDGEFYTVLTNQHVLKRGQISRIQTLDGRIYQANLVRGINFKGNDLVFLEFRGNANYAVASLGNLSTIAVNEQIFSAGFPFDSDPSQSNGFVFTEGKVRLVPQQALKEGYRIGYSNDIEKGMSGGPILNRQGKVIGINGIHANPLWGNPYIYEDGTQPTPAERDLMSRYSWGIPIQTIAQLAPQYISQDALPASNSPSNEGLPAIANEVNSIAQEITVLIKWPKGNGSGVIIAKKENTYYVLTAEHVLRDQTNKEVEVVTPADEKSHIVKVSDNTVKILPGVDLAVLQFTSTKNYQVATLANHDLEKKGGLVFVSGWVGSKPNEGKIIPLFTAGTLFEKQWGILQAKNPLSLTYGYGLVYTNVTEPGVSGGPILDSRGYVIGIHGRAEAEVVVEQAGYGRTMNLGYSLGIPTSTFLSLVTQTGIESRQLKIYNKPPSPLTDKEQNSIVKALFKLKQPTDNSDAVAWLNFGNQQWRLLNYKAALAAFDQAIKISPKFYEAWYARGLSLFDQEKYPEALDAFNKAIQASQESKKEFAPAWRGRGQALINLNRYKEALESFEKAIALNPNDLVVYIWQGTVLQTLGRYQDAIIAYDKAIRIKPHPWAYYNRGLVYSYLGSKQQAIADFNKVIEISPNYADAYTSLGYEEFKWGNTNAALVYLNKAIQIAPYYADAYFNRGIFRYYFEGKQQGISDLGKAIQLNPKNPYFYFRFGGIYYNEGDYQEAIRYYNKAIEINPLFGEVYYNRALANYKLGNKKAALENFQQAVRLFAEQGKDFFSKQTQARIQEIQNISSNVDLRNVATYQGNALNTTYKYPGHVTIKIAEIDSKSRKIKVQIEFTQGLNGEGLLEGVINSNNVADLSGIIGTLETAGFFDTKVKIEFIGNDKLKGVYTLEAGANNIAGRTQNGEFTATKVKEVSQDNSSKEGLNTQDAEVYLKRANARSSQGDYDGAITNYNEAIRLKADYAEAYFGRAIALAQKGEKQKAIEEFNTVLRLQPNSPNVYYLRGLVRADLKQYKEAIEDYTQMLRPQEFSGIGVKTELNPQTKVLIVTDIIKNSPAQRGGLKQGDQILAIDGKSTTGMNLEQAVQLIRGKVGTSVKLRAIHADNSAFNVSIIRVQIVDSIFAEVYYNRGLAYAKQGDKQKAREDFQKSAELYQQQDNKEMYKIVMDKVRELQK